MTATAHASIVDLIVVLVYLVGLAGLAIYCAGLDRNAVNCWQLALRASLGVG